MNIFNLLPNCIKISTMPNWLVEPYTGIEVGRTTTARSNAVGSKLPNELELYDMSGNVNEFNWDQWDGTAAYPIGALTDYRGGTGIYRVLHGGSWYSGASHCTMVSQGVLAHWQYSFATGFRVVRSWVSKKMTVLRGTRWPEASSRGEKRAS